MFTAEQQAQFLYKAQKGLGTDESKIIDVLVNCSNEKRQEIKKHYLTQYGHVRVLSFLEINKPKCYLIFYLRN